MIAMTEFWWGFLVGVFTLSIVVPIVGLIYDEYKWHTRDVWKGER